MPTYEYVCGSCHRHTEAQQSFTDPPLIECPHCGGRLKRVFHPVGIVLKGSGFYSTDNRSSRKTTDPGGKDAKDGKETTETKSTDTKPSGDAPAKSDTSAKPASSEKKSESKPAKKAKT